LIYWKGWILRSSTFFIVCNENSKSPLFLKRRYENTWTILILASIWIALLSFSLTPSVTEITLKNALSQRLVECTATSNGGHSNESVIFSITNKTNKAYRLKIPAGTTFQPADNGEQTLIQLEDDFIVLEGNQSSSKNLSAYCTEASDRCPTASSTFSLASNETPQINKLIQHIKANKTNSHNFQDAVWAITDNHSISNIYHEGDDAKKLREYLSELTGQENPWYNSPHEYEVQEDRTIRRNVKEIVGEIAFTCKPGTTIFEDICKADGTIMFSHENRNKPPHGNVRYEFKLKVTNWPQGDYYINIRSTEETIEKFEFSI